MHYWEPTDVCAARDTKGQDRLANVTVSLQPSVAIIIRSMSVKIDDAIQLQITLIY